MVPFTTATNRYQPALVTSLMPPCCTQSEMMMMMKTLTLGLYKIRIIQRVPGDAEIWRLASGMFRVADKNRDASLDVDEFVQWASHHVC